MPNKKPQNQRSRAWSPAAEPSSLSFPLSGTVPASEGCDNIYLELCSAASKFSVGFLFFCYLFSNCLPGDSAGKGPVWQCRRRKRHRFEPWVRKIPWRRKQKSTPVFSPGKSQGKRILAGYSRRTKLSDRAGIAKLLLDLISNFDNALIIKT